MGFTLAELLIALGILGVIATFTIPKVLQVQQENRSRAIVLEGLATIAGAYQQQQYQHGINTATRITDLTPLINYVDVSTLNIDTSSATTGCQPCGGSASCIKLHNGAVIRYEIADAFSGTSPLHAIQFMVDPNGICDGTMDGPGEPVRGFIFYNGLLKTCVGVAASTLSGGTVNSGCPDINKEPAYFRSQIGL